VYSLMWLCSVFVESDSDSDFTPGKVVLPEPKKGRKSKDKGGAGMGKRREAQPRTRGTRIDASGVSRENPLKSLSCFRL
jgi:hypothetical protein